jgi:FkbM family methyltransferase
MKLNVIWKTLTVTRNPTVGFLLKRSGARRTIEFKNHLTFNLTWPQYRVFRDNYAFFSRYKVTQLSDDLFEIVAERSKVSCKSELLPMMFELMQDYDIQKEAMLFHLKNKDVELFGSLAMLFCIRELRTGEYEYDYKDKIVLDVGGFEGESAVYFWQKGAKRIVIYEPVTEHVEFIKRNISLNKIEAEVHLSGIGESDGTKTIEYERTDPGFGIMNHGSKTMQIELTGAARAIEESNAQVGKFDCEGGELSLIKVPSEVLRRIEYYIIETHSPVINSAVKEKFINAGFILEKETPKPPTEFFILTFKRGNLPVH